MSYILDALRKADAQRERDSSRGIHAQAASLGSVGAQADDAGKRSGCMALVAVGAVLALGGGWYAMRGHEGAPAPASQPSPVAVPIQATPAATVISPPAPPAPPMPAAPAVLGAPRPATPEQAREAAFTARANPPGAKAPANSGAPPGAAPPPPASPVPGGLPADAPRITISGGVYSPNPAQRMLIVNGQVFNEGSEVAPGVKLEAVQARTAVLGFRGARYTVAY